jgi:NDP-sugar pyrophosphorylase family protein
MILAAGKGTRLEPLTRDIAKPMVTIGDRPVLEHTIEWLRSHGITDICINLHYKPESITRWFEDGSRFGVSLTYSYEEVILGTAGAVRQVAHYFREPFLVVYGDVLTNMNVTALRRFHEEHRAAITVALYHVENPSACGIVQLDDASRILRFIEKPKPEQAFTDLASAGVLVVDPLVFDYIPQGVFSDFGSDIFPALLANNVKLCGYELKDEFLVDIGTFENYHRAQSEWPRRSSKTC